MCAQKIKSTEKSLVNWNVYEKAATTKISESESFPQNLWNNNLNYFRDFTVLFIAIITSGFASFFYFLLQKLYETCVCNAASMWLKCNEKFQQCYISNIHNIFNNLVFFLCNNKSSRLVVWKLKLHFFVFYFDSTFDIYNKKTRNINF